VECVEDPRKTLYTGAKASCPTAETREPSTGPGGTAGDGLAPMFNRGPTQLLVQDGIDPLLGPSNETSAQPVARRDRCLEEHVTAPTVVNLHEHSRPQERV
jgi:hypothetical protein